MVATASRVDPSGAGQASAAERVDDRLQLGERVETGDRFTSDDVDASGASGVDDGAGLDQHLDAFSGYAPISEDLAGVLAGVGRGAAERR